MSRIINFIETTIIVSIILISCEKGDPGITKCNVSNPAEDIVWLKEAIDGVRQDEYSYFAMADFKGETVFYYGNCHPAINYVSIVQNCNGDTIGYTHDLYDQLNDITIVWKPEESKCNFQDSE